MNTRVKITVLLVGLGVLLAFVPTRSNSFKMKPTELVQKSAIENMYFSADEVARFVNTEDSTIQLIDIRGEQEYKFCNIPGSVNIPIADLLNPEWKEFLAQKNIRNVFYGNSDEMANIAWTLATGMQYENSFVMKGGLNGWFETVMLSEFSGKKITARENVLFENRYKARTAFTQFNSLPDSLKTKYFDAKRLQRKMLDGGCE
jgi:rhodanese-related sulfurtransferase